VSCVWHWYHTLWKRHKNITYEYNHTYKYTRIEIWRVIVLILVSDALMSCVWYIWISTCWNRWYFFHTRIEIWRVIVLILVSDALMSCVWHIWISTCRNSWYLFVCRASHIHIYVVHLMRKIFISIHIHMHVAHLILMIFNVQMWYSTFTCDIQHSHVIFIGMPYISYSYLCRTSDILMRKIFISIRIHMCVMHLILMICNIHMSYSTFRCDIQHSHVIFSIHMSYL